jgi:hypothetical protein
MAIIFHCDHCGKKIEAADTAGGKWGKCPACHNKIYVPGLDSDEELKLAPVDETEEEKTKRLMAETYRLTQDILQERQIPEGPNEATGPAEAGDPYEASGPVRSVGPISQMSENELTDNIIMCLRLMADGELDEARTIIDLIAPHRLQAAPIIDRIALSEIPEPELVDIPQQVLSGLIRTLRVKID